MPMIATEPFTYLNSELTQLANANADALWPRPLSDSDADSHHVFLDPTSDHSPFQPNTAPATASPSVSELEVKPPFETERSDGSDAICERSEANATKEPPRSYCPTLINGRW